MKKYDFVKKLALGVAVAGLGVWRANAIVAYNNPDPIASAGIQSGGTSYVLGNEFVVNQSINVTAIGAFDNQLNGFSGSGVQVAIYELTGSTWNEVLGTAETFSGTPAAGTYIGSSTFQNLSSTVNLGTGTYAVVAANYGTAGNEDWNRNLASGTPAAQGTTFENTSSAISIASGNYSFYGNGSTLGGSLSGLTYGNWGTPYPTFGAGTFEFNIAPVPEAAGFALAGILMLGLVYVGRCYMQKSKVA